MEVFDTVAPGTPADVAPFLTLWLVRYGLCLRRSRSPARSSSEDGKPVAGAQIVVHHSGRADTAIVRRQGDVLGLRRDAAGGGRHHGRGLCALSSRESAAASGPGRAARAPASGRRSSSPCSCPANRAPAWREPDTGATVLGRADLDSVPADHARRIAASRLGVLAVPPLVGVDLESDDARRHDARVVGIRVRAAGWCCSTACRSTTASAAGSPGRGCRRRPSSAWTSSAAPRATRMDPTRSAASSASSRPRAAGRSSRRASRAGVDRPGQRRSVRRPAARSGLGLRRGAAGFGPTGRFRSRRSCAERSTCRAT